MIAALGSSIKTSAGADIFITKNFSHRSFGLMKTELAAAFGELNAEPASDDVSVELDGKNKLVKVLESISFYT